MAASTLSKLWFFSQSRSILVVGSQWYRFHKGNQRKSPVTILAVTYEGILTITNAVRFQQTLQEGLGRGKAFGMGMLTIIRDKGAENE